MTKPTKFACRKYPRQGYTIERPNPAYVPGKSPVNTAMIAGHIKFNPEILPGNRRSTYGVFDTNSDAQMHDLKLRGFDQEKVISELTDPEVFGDGKLFCDYRDVMEERVSELPKEDVYFALSEKDVIAIATAKGIPTAGLDKEAVIKLLTSPQPREEDESETIEVRKRRARRTHSAEASIDV